MKLDAEALIRKLQQKEELPNVIVAFGKENYFRSQIGNLLQEYLFDGLEASDREITVFERDTNLKEVEAVINSYPFFGGKSLVIFKDEKLFSLGNDKDKDKKKISEEKKNKFKERQEKLGKILSDVPEYCTVFIDTPAFDRTRKLYKDLEKNALVCGCESIKVKYIAPWLDSLAKNLGGKLEFSAVGTIIEYLSLNFSPADDAPLELLSKEMGKLPIYAGEREVWTREDVQKIFADLPEASQYAVVNAVEEHKLENALRLLHDERKKGTAFLKICGGISFELRKLMRMKELMAEGFKQQQVTDITKLHPFIIKNAWPHCRKFSYEALRTAVVEISEMNAELRRRGRDWPRLEEILVKLLTA